MFVAASTECFPELNLDEVLQRLVDLEFTSVEIGIKESGNKMKPSEVLADVDRAVAICRDTHRLTVAAFEVDIEPGEKYYEQFAACCKLAKAVKVVMITIPGAELGTPFNAEIERLRELVSIASRDGVLVGVKTEVGRITQDPETAVVLCGNVKGLGITLDPSHFIFGPHKGGSYDQVFKHTYHVQLRDTRKDKFQVRVGQGEIEYGRLISQLNMVHYQRALSVHIPAQPDVDHVGELRKMRLLLESLL